MPVERVDYYSDEEYQQALEYEEWENQEDYAYEQAGQEQAYNDYILSEYPITSRIRLLAERFNF